MDCTELFINAKKAGRELLSCKAESVKKVLLDLAVEAESHIPDIVSANKKDLDLMDKSDPRYDRLQLTEKRIKNIAADIRNIAGLPSPSGRIISEYNKPDGLHISRITVPFGVIGIIYEARPNVTFDVFSLCIKSGNVCILKGGSDAFNSNSAITEIIRNVLEKNRFSRDIITLLPSGREETIQMLKAVNYIDLIIPRGSRQLIDFVRENARIPIIETGAGICHTYFDEYGDTEKGRQIILNAKTRRVSVCNALDCLVIHERRLGNLYDLVKACAESKVLIHADEEAYESLKGKYSEDLLMRATEKSFGTEFLSYQMAIKTVSSFTGALEHIEKYSSRHSEAIISEDESRIRDFLTQVDAAAVYSNSSTAFTDGAEFGLGAETGISTQKLHARGPMALEALNTYKWIIKGNGQVRS